MRRRTRQFYRSYTGKSAEKRKRAARLAAGLLLALVLLTGLSAAVCRYCIHVKPYTIALDTLEKPVRLAMLADLHDLEFGEDNCRLLAKMEAQQPSAIFLVGDMVDRGGEQNDVDALIGLIHGFQKIAPVFFAPGNHEIDYMEKDPTLLDQIAASGAVVVNDSFVDTEIDGQLLRIGGTVGHGFYFGRTKEEFEASPEYRFLKEFETAEWPTICLAHLPDTFIFNGAYTLWDVDLALSGHTHGGLIRLPFIGGVYAPMQGWFPDYDRGWFRLGEHMQMVITAGMAGHGWVPRINNLPELTVLDLVPEASGTGCNQEGEYHG